MCSGPFTSQDNKKSKYRHIRNFISLICNLLIQASMFMNIIFALVYVNKNNKKKRPNMENKGELYRADPRETKK